MKYRSTAGRAVSALTVALLTSTALALPEVARAATLPNPSNVAGTTNTIDAAGTYVAPAVTLGAAENDPNTWTTARQRFVAMNLAGLANAGTVTLWAYYYDGSGNFVGRVAVANDASPDGTTAVLENQSPLSNSAAVASVRFAVQFADAGDGVGVADAVLGVTDILAGAATPGDANMKVSFVSLNLTQADPAGDIADALKLDGSVESYALGSDYTGPEFTARSSFTGAGTTNPTLLGFNVGVKSQAGGDILAATDRQAEIDVLGVLNPTPLADPIFFDADARDGAPQNVALGSREAWLTANTGVPNAQFAETVDAVRVLVAGADITDLANNPLEELFSATITTFPSPDFAATGKPVLVSGTSSPLPVNDVIDAIEGNGLDLNFNEVIVLTVRMNDDLDDAASGFSTTDVTVAGLPANMQVFSVDTGATADDDKFNVTLRVTGGDVDVTIDADGDILLDDTEVKVGLAVGGSPLTTAFGQEIAAATPSDQRKTVNNALVPAPVLQTLDADADGTLDGFSYDAIGQVNTPLSTDGIEIQDQDDPADTATIESVTRRDGDESLIDVAGNQAQIIGFLNAGQTQADNLNTGSVGAALPFVGAVVDSPITYSFLYGIDDGEPQEITDATGKPPFDGAGPILLSAAATKGVKDETGTLALGFSETMFDGGQISEITDGGGSLSLNILNAGGNTSQTATRQDNLADPPSNANRVLVFGVPNGIPNEVIDGFGDIGIRGGNESIVDLAGNPAPQIAVSPTTADATDEGPDVTDVVSVVESNADLSVTEVLVFVDEDVNLNGTQQNLINTFDITFCASSTPINVSPSSVAANNNVITLEIPNSAGVNLRQLEKQDCLNDTEVSYNQTSTAFIDDDDENKLADFSGKNSADPSNTLYIYTLTLGGQIIDSGLSGSDKSIERGSLVRGDVVRLAAQQDGVERGNVTVPCNCEGAKSRTFALEPGNLNNLPNPSVPGDPDRGGLANILKDAARLGKKDQLAYLAVTTSNSDDIGEPGHTPFISIDHPGLSDDWDVFEINISTDTSKSSTVKITSPDKSITGSIVLSKDNSGGLKLEKHSTSYDVVKANGEFRVTVGIEEWDPGFMVIISSRRPGGEWTPHTFFDQSLSPNIPFRTDLEISKATEPKLIADDIPVGTSQTGLDGGLASGLLFDTQAVGHTSIIYDSGGAPFGGSGGEWWQIVGVPGELMRTTTLDAFGAQTFFGSINTCSGEPINWWAHPMQTPLGDRNDAFGAGQGTEDEALVVLKNEAWNDFELGQTQVKMIKKNFGTPQAIALRMGAHTAHEINDCRSDVFYPKMPGDVLPVFDAPAGWHLLTANQDVDLTGSLNPACGVGMIIEAGGGLGARTWVRGAANNTLGSLNAENGYFFWVEKATKDFFNTCP